MLPRANTRRPETYTHTLIEAILEILQLVGYPYQGIPIDSFFRVCAVFFRMRTRCTSKIASVLRLRTFSNSQSCPTLQQSMCFIPEAGVGAVVKMGNVGRLGGEGVTSDPAH